MCEGCVGGCVVVGGCVGGGRLGLFSFSCHLCIYFLFFDLIYLFIYLFIYFFFSWSISSHSSL